MMVEEFKSSPKREFQRPRNHHKVAVRNDLLEAIAQVNNGAKGGRVVAQSTSEDGRVRMKIVLRKQDLKQMLEAMKDSARPPPSLSLEQSLMRRRISAGKANHGRWGCRSSWRPIRNQQDIELANGQKPRLDS
ncbi:hypothetical protein Ancab_028125 [Ancistrocladus abbreviatus]